LKDNIKIDSKEIGYEDVDWIHLAQKKYQWLSVVKTVMKLKVPYKTDSFLDS
jgi:hypothetical protein